MTGSWEFYLPYFPEVTLYFRHETMSNLDGSQRAGGGFAVSPGTPRRAAREGLSVRLPVWGFKLRQAMFDFAVYQQGLGADRASHQFDEPVSCPGSIKTVDEQLTFRHH